MDTSESPDAFSGHSRDASGEALSEARPHPTHVTWRAVSTSAGPKYNSEPTFG
jgi:hypothetical protein